MKLIVGLGNPGEKYQNNRHNVGFWVVERLGILWELNKKFEAEMVLSDKFILVKPQTFMNESGRAVVKIINFYKISLSDVYVVHDDLDIALGNYKIQYGKGPQIHNGLLSIEKELGTDQFWNVRVGVENREVRGNRGTPGAVYSLQDFTVDEQKIIENVIESVRRELLEILQGQTL